MNYRTGEKIKLGDYVQLSEDMTGIIVGVIEESIYSELYPKDEWGYLGSGLLILSDQAGLIHIPKISEDIKLICKE